LSPPAKTKTPSPEFAFANFSSTPFPFYKIPSHEANSEDGINGIGEVLMALSFGVLYSFAITMEGQICTS